MKICYIPPKDKYKNALSELMNINQKARKYFLLAIMLLMCTDCFAEEINPVTKLGFDAVSLFQLILTLIAIIMTLFEVGRALLECDPKRIPSIIAKYAIGVICVYAVPVGFLKIRDAFADWRELLCK